jgi:hypothetical protein
MPCRFPTESSVLAADPGKDCLPGTNSARAAGQALREEQILPLCSASRSAMFVQKCLID